ncbi:GNAT family N-acetyltransferase [Fodinicola feengrottensis]|uniref:GNAT family N-acetyltransferase n=1 Tax=Fodinicola feengrottensis TaxID=435914 RepID=UPI002441FA7D|nr:hypothetical protein [Fodinicola feengrottensis]
MSTQDGYPEHRAADVLLSDGGTVHIRPIRATDADQVVALHSRFSERTRYLRYFSPYPRIPERDLKRFVTVDHVDREAFVVELGDELIAIGRFDRISARTRPRSPSWSRTPIRAAASVRCCWNIWPPPPRKVTSAGSSPRCCRRTTR